MCAHTETTVHLYNAILLVHYCAWLFEPHPLHVWLHILPLEVVVFDSQ